MFGFSLGLWVYSTAAGFGPVTGDVRVTDNGNTRVTSGGDIRVIGVAPTSPRVTDNGNTRVTSAGDTRVVSL